VGADVTAPTAASTHITEGGVSGDGEGDGESDVVGVNDGVNEGVRVFEGVRVGLVPGFSERVKLAPALTASSADSPGGDANRMSKLDVCTTRPPYEKRHATAVGSLPAPEASERPSV
jgi:hypothetical protein